MTDLFDEGEGATPLDPDEREGLKVSWVTFRRDLRPFGRYLRILVRKLASLPLRKLTTLGEGESYTHK